MTRPTSRTPAAFNEKPVFALSKVQIEEAAAIAASSPHGTYRICLHDSPEARLHQMLIVMPRNAYVRPKRHAKKIKSYHMIRGEMLVLVFNSDGTVRERIEMGEFATEKYFCFRLSSDLYHTVIPLSPQVIFHEVTDGPFVPEEVIQAPWAPPYGDEAVASYLVSLLK